MIEKIDLTKVKSVALRRLIEEVRRETEEEAPVGYNRVYNRHMPTMPGGYNRVYNRHNR